MTLLNHFAGILQHLIRGPRCLRMGRTATDLGKGDPRYTFGEQSWANRSGCNALPQISCGGLSRGDAIRGAGLEALVCVANKGFEWRARESCQGPNEDALRDFGAWPNVSHVKQ